MTNIKLHGMLGKAIGQEWNLKISSVAEAIRAIQILSKKKLFNFLYEKDKENVKYQVLINGRDFEANSPLSIDNLESIKNSELCIKNPNIKTIDIVPIIEGAGSFGSYLAIIAGVILIAVGVILMATGIGGPLGAAFIVAGAGLLMAGVINLLTQPPQFDDFNEISGNRRSSYMFDGPQNVAREGIPVPIGYGRLLVGSAVISATYEVTDIRSDVNEVTS